MDLLTGKAKEDFEKWARYDKYTEAKIDSNLINCNFNSEYYKNITKNSLIIEWLDSVGIVIQIDYDSAEGGLFCCNLGIDNKLFATGDTRRDATTEAIKQANIIYNESN